METTYANLLPIAREIRLTKSGLWISRVGGAGRLRGKKSGLITSRAGTRADG